MTINFYLNNDNRRKGDEKAIYCYVRHNYQTLTLHTHEHIQLKHWDKEKQRVKRTYVGSPELNEYLDSLKQKVQRIIRSVRIDNPTADFEMIKTALSKEFKPKKSNTFYTVFDTFIELRKESVTSGTTQKYTTLKKHLINFEANINFKMSFENIDFSFLDNLQKYFYSVKLSSNTIRKNLQFLNSFLKWAAEREYHSNYKFASYKLPKEIRKDAFSLSLQNLRQIQDYKPSSSKLEHVRDVFLFMVYTGQRFSDVSRLKSSDIREGHWKLTQFKTKKTVTIPLINSALEILNKYDMELPIVSNQKTNKYLKEMAKDAGLTELITDVGYFGNERISKSVPIHDVISTHTARRTFVSLSSLGGVNQQVVQSITGHSSTKMVSRYYDSNKTNAAKELIEDVFKSILSN